MEALHRIFIGGLFESITKDELKDRFESFGDVSDVTIVQKKDGEGLVSKTFGYVNLKTTTPKLNKCFAVYGGTKWKGHQLKVQLAKEDFMTKLQREREEPPVVVKKKKKRQCSGPTKTYTDILETTSTMKKTVPGTPIEGERNWVVGKYGRPLPIVYIPNVGGRKTMKVDPSKFCHCLKKIGDDDDGDVMDVEKLTWTYNDDDNVIQTKKKTTKKKKRSQEESDDGVEANIHNDNTTLITHSGEDLSNTCRKKKKKNKMKENIPDPLDGDVSLDLAGEDAHVSKQKRKNVDNEVDADNGESGEKGEKADVGRLELSVEIEGLVEDVVGSHKQKKKRRHKDKEEQCDIKSSTPLTSNSATSFSISDDLLCKEKKKRKHKKVKDGSEDIVAMPITPLQTEVTIKQDGGLEDTSNCCVPEIPSFDNNNICDEIEVNEKPLQRRLSTSIIEQLLSNKKSTTSLSQNYEPASQLSKTNESDVGQNGIDKNSENIDDDDESENMFDFEFGSINGKKKSFLSSLLNSIELREDDDNESGEDSDVESECSSSNSSNSNLHSNSNCSLQSLESKGPSLDADNENDINEIDFKVVQEIGSKQVNRSTDDEQKECVKSKNVVNTDDTSRVKNVINTDETSRVKNTVNTDDTSRVKNIVNTEDTSRVKKAKILNSNKQEKRALSEEKRAKSLSERNSQIVQNKDAVSKALKDVDKLSCSTNRIVFNESDDDDEEEEEEEKEEKEDEDVVEESGGGSKKCLWSDDEEEEDGPSDGNNSANGKQLFDDAEDEETSDDEISLKPQFHGKEGEKLFKMQQRFGGDERFKLDERFAEDNGEDKTADNNETSVDVEENDGTENDEDLQKEKEMNISVLEKVLGKPIALEKKDCDYGQAYQRYDPENTEHEKYEVKPAAKSTKEDDESDALKSKTSKVVQQKLPEVSKETFYSVNESIKDLFTKGESTSFSFLGNDDEDATPENNDAQDFCEEIGCENQGEEEEEAIEQMEIETDEKSAEGAAKTTSWKKGLEDILKAEEALKAEKSFVTEEDIETDEKEMKTYLFFPEGDKRLEIGKSFIRTEDIDEITNQWKSIRRSLTEDYKKKHKDAVRRVRKMREKRMSSR